MYRRISPQARDKTARIDRWWDQHPDGKIPGAHFGLGAVDALERALVGYLVLPSDAGYNKARHVYHTQFISDPQIVVYCEVEADVYHALAFAHEFSLRVTCRSGGHCSAGWSANGAMILDTSGLDNYSVDCANQRLTVGAGISFDRLTKVLDHYKTHIVTGGCGGVCLAGYMQGGGYGFTSREFGINCDGVLSVKVMLADGTTVTADKSQNSDLLWAVCGGTGNTFGVLLEITYQLQDLYEVWGFALRWDDRDTAAAALVELQQNYMISGASPKLGYQAGLVIADGKPRFVVRGMYHGKDEEGESAIASLTAIGKEPLVLSKRGTYLQLNEWLLDHPTPLPNVPDDVLEDKHSDYIVKQLSHEDWRAFIDRFGANPPNPWVNIGIEPYGGAIKAFPADGNAFIHRDVYMNFFVEVFWKEASGKPVAESWMRDLMASIAPFGNGHAYQNYPSPSQPGEPQRFWGDALERLAQIKNKYDPDNFFNHAEGVQPTSQ